MQEKLPDGYLCHAELSDLECSTFSCDPRRTYLLFPERKENPSKIKKLNGKLERLQDGIEDVLNRFPDMCPEARELLIMALRDIDG